MISDHFLEKLGILFEQCDFKIAVDEVLTGGWRTEFLQNLKKPYSLRMRVDYLCVCKWIGMVMVLCNEKWMDKIGQNVAGKTIETNYNEAIKALEVVIPLLGNISEQ
jgi:hypothetical protein